MSDAPATPAAVTPTKAPAVSFGLFDAKWTEDQWKQLIEKLVTDRIFSWKDIASLTLGHLNPSQVGTSLASSDGFKRRYGKGNTMSVVMKWAYAQAGVCVDCGTRLELQADHIKGRETYKDPLDADFIENMTLRCRRHNVVRRPTHEFGGLTFLTAESALMWILLVIRPRTYIDYVRLCRIYGMTMSDIRMAEAWAMAHWLANSKPPLYDIENDSTGHYDLVVWPDNAVTRVRSGEGVPAGGTILLSNVSGGDYFGFVTRRDGKVKVHEQHIAAIPFCTYDLEGRELQALAIRYSAPDRDAKTPQEIKPLHPRGCELLAFAVRPKDQHFVIESDGKKAPVVGAPSHGKALPFLLKGGKVVLSLNKP